MSGGRVRRVGCVRRVGHVRRVGRVGRVSSFFPAKFIVFCHQRNGWGDVS